MPSLTLVFHCRTARVLESRGLRRPTGRKLAISARASAPPKATRKEANPRGIKVGTPQNAHEVPDSLTVVGPAVAPLVLNERSHSAIEPHAVGRRRPSEDALEFPRDEEYDKFLGEAVPRARTASGVRGWVDGSLGHGSEGTDEEDGMGDEGEESGVTELIFRLDRNGTGWGEEILPSLTVEHRPVKRRRERNRSSMPRPWTVRCTSFSPSHADIPLFILRIPYLVTVAPPHLLPCLLPPTTSVRMFTCSRVDVQTRLLEPCLPDRSTGDASAPSKQIWPILADIGRHIGPVFWLLGYRLRNEASDVLRRSFGPLRPRVVS